MFKCSRRPGIAIVVFAFAMMLTPSAEVDAAIYAGQTVRVYGMDSTPAGAQQNAYNNMLDAIIAMIIDLDPNEVIVDVVVEDEYFATSTLYVIDFHAIFETEDGNSGENGGNVGNGQ